VTASIAQLVNEAYFLITDKAIITKLDRHIEQVIFTQTSKFEGQKGRGLGYVTYSYILGLLLYYWNG